MAPFFKESCRTVTRQGNAKAAENTDKVPHVVLLEMGSTNVFGKTG